VRAELRELKTLIAASAARGDLTRRAHLQGLADTIGKALDPRFAPPANPLAAVLRVMGHQADLGWDAWGCWPGHDHPVSHDAH
jgi:hypothetical protein